MVLIYRLKEYNACRMLGVMYIKDRTCYQASTIHDVEEN